MFSAWIIPCTATAAMQDQTRALLEFAEALRRTSYRFVAVTPATHQRVNARAVASGRGEGTTLRDVFGWSRPFRPGALPSSLVDLAYAAGVIREAGPLLRSTVRLSSLGDDLFLHSAFPTAEPDAVFFGPDTYRFCDLIRNEVGNAPARIVDVGCGSGVGGLIAARQSDARVVLGDINDAALRLAVVNAALAGLSRRVEIVKSDVLDGVDGELDLVVANPPYMVDPGRRTYRDGGGVHGEALAMRITRDALARLAPQGRLVLYTGAAVVGGSDRLLEALRPICEESAASWRYWEIDPDVFGEEIEQNDAYADVERIAAVALVVTAR
jgi:SAM-dependent methyltransferase